MANEAYFIRQRSLLHLPSKPVAFLIQGFLKGVITCHALLF